MNEKLFKGLLLGTACVYGLIMTLAYVDKVQTYKLIAEAKQDEIDTLKDKLTIAEDTLTIIFNQPWDTEKLRTEEVTIFGYNSEVGQTDSTPFLTATGKRVTKNGAALTDDLEIDYGQNVLIVGYGLVTKNDHMPKRKKSLDLWCPTREEALGIGRQDRTIIWLSK